jgi:hypothetical protein
MLSLTELTGHFGQERGEKVGRSRMIDESTITGNSQLVLNSELVFSVWKAVILNLGVNFNVNYYFSNSVTLWSSLQK